MHIRRNTFVYLRHGRNWLPFFYAFKPSPLAALSIAFSPYPSALDTRGRKQRVLRSHLCSSCMLINGGEGGVQTPKSPPWIRYCQISSDPYAKHLRTWPKHLACPSKRIRSHKPISSYLYGQKYCTLLQYSARESAHIYDFRVIILFFLFFFSKPAISMAERVDVLNFLINVSKVDRGVHSHQAIAPLLLHIYRVDHQVLHK